MQNENSLFTHPLTDGKLGDVILSTKHSASEQSSILLKKLGISFQCKYREGVQFIWCILCLQKHENPKMIWKDTIYTLFMVNSFTLAAKLKVCTTKEKILA